MASKSLVFSGYSELLLKDLLYISQCVCDRVRKGGYRAMMFKVETSECHVTLGRVLSVDPLYIETHNVYDHVKEPFVSIGINNFYAMNSPITVVVKFYDKK